jgi:glycosyltransferase involved in cell wall biosynthesis
LPERLQVVTLIDGLGVTGGGERVARNLVVSLDPDRFQRTLCVSRWDPAVADDPPAAEALAELQQAGVEFLGLRRGSVAAIGAWRPLLRLLRDRGVEILHSHKFGSNVWGAVVAPLARTPVFVAHEHTWNYVGNPGRKFLDRRLVARNADVIVAVSREDQRRMIEVEHIPPEKIVYIPNGIPEPPAAASQGSVRDELGIGPDQPVVGTVCVLRPQKDVATMLRAMALVAERVADLKVVIAGDGGERPALERLIAELGLGDVVVFLGRRTDVPDVLAAFDVAVCSSVFEGSPLAVMEFMEAGLPIVATKVGGVPDLVDEGEGGYLVAPGDAATLAERVCKLLADPEAARRMGQHGQRRRREEFAIDVAARRTEELYERLYAQARR